MAISTSSGEVYEDEMDYMLGHSINEHKDQPSPMGDKKSNNPVPMIWTHMEDLGTLKPTIRQDTLDDELGVKSLGVGPQSNRDLDRRTPPPLPMSPSPSIEPKMENKPHPPGYTPGQKLSSLVIRHGSTEDNAEDKNKPGERIRGWRDVPLSEQGRKEAAAAADKLEHAGIDTIYTSDLQRARHTAEAISETTGAPIVEEPGLRPWNLGNLQGKDVKEAKGECEDCVRNPDKVVPGGESFNTFKDRFLSTMARLEQEPGKKAYVTHFRNTHVLKHLDENGELDVDNFLQFDKNSVKPGGIMKLAMEDKPKNIIDLPMARAKGESAGGSVPKGPAEVIDISTQRAVDQALGKNPILNKTKTPLREEVKPDPYDDAVIDQSIKRTMEQAKAYAIKQRYELTDDNVAKLKQSVARQIMTKAGQRLNEGIRRWLGEEEFNKLIKSNPVDLTPFKK